MLEEYAQPAANIRAFVLVAGRCFRLLYILLTMDPMPAEMTKLNKLTIVRRELSNAMKHAF